MKKTCFVISPIDDEGTPTRKRSDQIFKYVIKPAVEKFGYIALRADSISKPGIITTQIINNLIKSELVIADLAEKNPNVFYELGIRHTVRKHVIQITDPNDTIPFDVGGVRTIKVDFRYIDSMDNCKNEIIKQIEAIEKGEVQVESPVTFTINFTSTEDTDSNKQQEINVQLLSQIQNLKADMDAMKRRTIPITRVEWHASDTEHLPGDIEYHNAYADHELIKIFNEVFSNLSKKGKDDVRERDLILALEETGMFGRGEVREFISKMLREGALFERRAGYYAKA